MSAVLPPRFIQQPGPVHPERIVATPCKGRSFHLVLEPGLTLLEAVRRGFAAEGFTSGVVEMADIRLGPFAYVMPGLSTTGENAAFYSDVFRPSGITRVEHGAMTFGMRDGAPFYHCHGLWVEADGTRSGGHMMPDATIVEERATVKAFGLDGAAFVAEADPEINFKVFGPVVAPANDGGTCRAVALRPRPNQDFHEVIAKVCADHGFRGARLRGGVGSTIGVVFDDGRVMENFATELYIESGAVKAVAGGFAIDIDVGMIDYTGQIARGRLQRGANPVLMTFELVVEEA